MMVLDAGLDEIFHAYGVFYKGGVAVFKDLAIRLRAEMVGFLLFVRAADCGRKK